MSERHKKGKEKKDRMKKKAHQTIQGSRRDMERKELLSLADE
jgi:hypothetical protein